MSATQIGNVRIVVAEDTLIARHFVIPEDPRVVAGDPQATQNLLLNPDYLPGLGQA